MKDKKVIFMGTPEFSVPVLKELIDKTNVIMVVTQPDSLVGRKQELRFSLVKEEALKHGIEIYQPVKIKNEYEHILEAKPDIIITCAYGQIIPEILLETPEYKAINVHASLLPKLRGGSPLHRAILNDYKETGITIMYMAPGMDDGDIIAQSKINIEDNDNVGTIHDKLSLLGKDLLFETLPSIFDKSNKRIKQDESEVTFAYNIKREEEHIDFNRLSREVFNHIRGMYPYPCAYVYMNDEVLKICSSYIGEETNKKPGDITNVYKDGFGIMCLDKEIVVTKLKPAGKREMTAVEYINGKRKENILGGKIC